MTVSAYPPTARTPLGHSQSPSPTTALPHPRCGATFPASPSGLPPLVTYGAQPLAAQLLAHRPLLSHGRGVVRPRLMSPHAPPLPRGWLGALQDGEERRCVTVPSSPPHPPIPSANSWLLTASRRFRRKIDSFVRAAHHWRSEPKLPSAAMRFILLSGVELGACSLVVSGSAVHFWSRVIMFFHKLSRNTVGSILQYLN